jgi:hypothetical protein
MKIKCIFLFFLFQFNFNAQVIEETSMPFNNSSSNGYQSNPEIDRIISIVNTVESKNNFIDQLNPDSNVSLPFGIMKQIGAVRYTIAIDSMRFLSNGAQAKLYLASDHLIPINSTVSLKLLGNGQNWVEWDCNGFKAINLVGNFIFKKGKLLPDLSQTSDSVVTASFQLYTEDLHNFIAGVNITPFKIDGLSDWSFKVTNAIVDMSELSNANMEKICVKTKK